MTDSRGPWLSSATALFYVWAVLALLVRVWVKLKASNWGLDDSTISAGMAVALMHVAAIFWAIHWGYGLPIASIPEPAKDQVEKALYASQFFYVLALGLSKVSTALFVGRLTRYKPQVRMANIIVTVSGVWTTASILVIALRGNLTHPWAVLDGSEAMFARWVGIEVVGLLIEVALLALSINLVWGLHMALHKRVLILGAFGCRLILIPTVAVRLFYLSPPQNPDPTFTSIIANILTEAVLDVSFISASITSLRPFLRPFHSGYIVNSVGAPGSGLLSGSRKRPQDSYQELSAIKGTAKGRLALTVISGVSQEAPQSNTEPLSKESKFQNPPKPDLPDRQVVVAAPGSDYSSRVHRNDRGSVASTSSAQMIIQKTTDWNIRYERDEDDRQQEQEHEFDQVPRLKHSSQAIVSARSSKRGSRVEV